MSGFDNGTLQSGIFAQVKQLGSILRGFGPPVPQAGSVGDIYIDTQSWFLYSKRSTDAAGNVDAWGHYLFQVPAAYRASLKWFSAYQPTDDIGITGDYCLLWGGQGNYGMQPSIFGPKLATATGSAWPENGNGPNTSIASAGAGTVIQAGLLDEGTPLTYSNSSQLIVAGLADEYVLGVPVTLNAGDVVLQVGVQSGPVNVPVAINPLYTAEDTHNI